ncbi:MAG: IS630 family transposase [Acidobacteriota bacterium]|nr:IS630 family transposase [Acidobacteriota bacterium]
MPGKTILEIPAAEQAQMLAQLRAARYGHLLALHILLLCAAGWSPTQIAAALFCSRSSVYRLVADYCAGNFDLGLAGAPEADAAAVPLRRKCASLKRSLLAEVSRAPSAFGWCRTRWSCAALALELRARRGVSVAPDTIRHWLHQLGYVWKRARHVAKDDDPERVAKLARIRSLIEGGMPSEALFFADELDIHLLPKIGYEWMLRGTQTEVMTPGTNQKNYLAGALNYLTGRMVHVVGERKNRFLFIDLLKMIDQKYPAAKFTTVYVVCDNYRIHTAQVVGEWLDAHPRFELVFLPSYCPKANPIERAFGDVHDKCTRNHKRTRISDLVSDVVWHLKRNGPWRYKLSAIYHTPEIDQAVAELADARNLKAA